MICHPAQPTDMDGIKEEVLQECFGRQPLHTQIVRADPEFATDLLVKVRTMLLDARIYLKDRNNGRSNKVLKILFANKCVLSAASETFRKLYLDNYQDVASFWLNEFGCATISDFESVIDFIYSGRIMMDLENIEQILHIAGHLKIAALIRLCENYLKSMLNNGTCIKVFLVLCENDEAVGGSKTLAEMKTNLQRRVAVQFGRSVRDKAIYKYSLKDILHLLENGCLTELDQGKLGLHFACTLIYNGKQTSDSQMLLKVARLAVSRMMENTGTLTEPMKQKLIEQVRAVNELVRNYFKAPGLLDEFITKLSGSDRRDTMRKTRHHERSKYAALIETKQGDEAEEATVKTPTIHKNNEKKSIIASKCIVDNSELQIKTSENKAISTTKYTVGNTKCKRKDSDDSFTTTVQNCEKYPLCRCSNIINGQSTPKPEFNDYPSHTLENESRDEETVNMEHGIGENVVVKVESDNSRKFMELGVSAIIQNQHAFEIAEDSIKCEAGQEANIDTVCGPIPENIIVKVEPSDLSTYGGNASFKNTYLKSMEENLTISPGISDNSMTENCAESDLEPVIKIERVNDDNTIEQFVLQTGKDQRDVSYPLKYTAMNGNIQAANTLSPVSPSMPWVLDRSFKSKDGPDRAAIDDTNINNSFNLKQPMRSSSTCLSQTRKRPNTHHGTGIRKKRKSKFSDRTVAAINESMEASSGKLYDLIVQEQVAGSETKPGTGLQSNMNATIVNLFSNVAPSTPEQGTVAQSSLHKCSLNIETTTDVELENRNQTDITEVDKCVSPNNKDSDDDEVPVHREVRNYKTRTLHQPKLHSCKGYNNVTVIANKLPMSVAHVSNIKNKMASHKNACKGDAKHYTAAASSCGTLPDLIDSQGHFTEMGVEGEKPELIGTLPETEMQATGLIGKIPATKSNVQDTTVVNMQSVKCQMENGWVVKVSIIPKHRIKTLRKCDEEK